MIHLQQRVFSLHGSTGIPLAWQAAEYANCIATYDLFFLNMNEVDLLFASNLTFHQGFYYRWRVNNTFHTLAT